MNTNYTTIALLCTLSLVFHPAMADTSLDQATESFPLSTEEQQRVATLTQLGLNLAAHYHQAYLSTDVAPYDHNHFNLLHWLAYVGDGQKDDLPQKIKNQLATVDYAQDIPLLLKSGIDVNIATPKGLTPLMLAVSAGHRTVVEHLLSCPEIAVNAKTKRGATALMFAAHQGHTEVVELLLDCTAVDINATTQRRATALIFAAYQGHADVVELLLACTGIAVNAQTTLGEAALTLAAYQGHADIVKQLLIHPAINVNTENGLTTTALALAAYQGHADIVEQLLAHPAIAVNTTLPLSLNNYLIGPERMEVTALMLAAYKGQVAIVHQLLAHSRIKVNAQTLRGDTALDFARQRNCRSVINLLKDKGGATCRELAIKRWQRKALYSFGAMLAIIGHIDVVGYFKNNDFQKFLLSTSRQFLFSRSEICNAQAATWQDRVIAYSVWGVVGSIFWVIFLEHEPPSKSDKIADYAFLLDLEEYPQYIERIAQQDLVLY